MQALSLCWRAQVARFVIYCCKSLISVERSTPSHNSFQCKKSLNKSINDRSESRDYQPSATMITNVSLQFTFMRKTRTDVTHTYCSDEAVAHIIEGWHKCDSALIRREKSTKIRSSEFQVGKSKSITCSLGQCQACWAIQGGLSESQRQFLISTIKLTGLFSLQKFQAWLSAWEWEILSRWSSM